MPPDFVLWLQQPSHYPVPTGSVTLKSTHISLVCLTDDRVYKIKKPVKFSFLDFSTLEKRKFYCEEELRLNRRLCPDIYLEVTPIWKAGEGDYSFSATESGEIIDYAVVMKRLPEELFMKDCLDERPDIQKDITSLAKLIAAFHCQPAPGPEIIEAGAPRVQRKKILGNFEETYEPGIFSEPLYSLFKERVLREMGHLMPWLEKRSEAGKIIEGHGDLHTGNIFLTDPPSVFDCIEFSPEFRCGDPAMENAFMIMDLIYQGRSDLADLYFKIYTRETGDIEQVKALPMLIAYQAMVRAKVEALMAMDSSIPAEERAGHRTNADRYLLLASASLAGREPVLLMVCGLPGSGKSYLCDQLSRRFGWVHLASDSIRKELAGFSVRERLPLKFYTEDFSRKTYREMKRRAVAALGDRPVLADANFPSKTVRETFSSEVEARKLIVWVTCDFDTVSDRLRDREKESGEISDAGIDVYQKLAKRFEPPDAGDENIQVLELDGAEPVEKNIRTVLEHLLECRN